LLGSGRRSGGDAARDAFGNPIASAGPAQPAPASLRPGAVPAAGHVPASWGNRAAAAVIDAVVGLVLPVTAAALVGASVADAAGVVLLLAAFAFAWLVYGPACMARRGEHNGQTPGKQMVGIRVVRETAEPITYGYALVREFVVKQLLIGLIGGLLLYLPLVLNYLWPLWDADNRALHDMVASTRVIRS
jgi:uncharacterized RDD family membrane protein YckC